MNKIILCLLDIYCPNWLHDEDKERFHYNEFESA